MKELISVLITSGGLGFSNVLFLERTGILFFDNRQNNDRYLWLVVFSAVNYVTMYYTSNLWITITVSTIATLLVYFANYKLENWMLKKTGQSNATDKNAWDYFWDKVFGKKDIYIMVFDLSTKELLDFGSPIAITRSTDTNSGIALNLDNGQIEEYSLVSYLDALKMAESYQSSKEKGASSYSDYINNKKYIVLWSD